MKIHPIIASAAISAILLLQGWLLSETVKLRADVATLTMQVKMHVELTANPQHTKGKI